MKKYFNEIINNKIYIIWTLLIFICGYGFSIVNHTIGIDDFGVDHYLDVSPENYGNMLQQGRITHLLVFYIFRIVDFIPFLNNFLAMLLLWFSAIILVTIFQYISNNYFKSYQLIIFTGIYGTFSNIAFKFIYDLDVVVTYLSYALIPLTIALILEFIENKNNKCLVLSAILLVLAIGSYETFNILYVLEVLFIIVLFIYFRGYKLFDVIKLGALYFINLLISFFIYYVVVFIFRDLTNNKAYVRTNIFNNGIPLKEDLLKVYNKITNIDFLFNIEIVYATIILLVLSAIFLIVYRKYMAFILIALFVCLSFTIHIIQGNYFIRTGQVFNFYVAATILLLFIVFKKVDKLIVIFAVILITLQIKDLNKWFYKDYINYQKNVYAIHKIATDLVADFDVDNKPVLFINRDYESKLLHAWDDNQGEIGESALVSSVRFLGNKTSPETIKLFEYNGYTFIKEPTLEQANEIYNKRPKLNKYPNKGYIEEIDGIIVVNMGDNNGK